MRQAFVVFIFCLFMFSCNETEIGTFMVMKLQNESGVDIKEATISFEVPSSLTVDTPIVIGKMANGSFKDVRYNLEHIMGYYNVSLKVSVVLDNSSGTTLEKTSIGSLDNQSNIENYLVIIKSDKILVSSMPK